MATSHVFSLDFVAGPLLVAPVERNRDSNSQWQANIAAGYGLDRECGILEFAGSGYRMTACLRN